MKREFGKSAKKKKKKPLPVVLPVNVGYADVHLTDGQWFSHGLSLPANLADIDAYLYKKARAKFDALVDSGRNFVNTTAVLDTDKAKNIHVGPLSSAWLLYRPFSFHERFELSKT